LEPEPQALFREKGKLKRTLIASAYFQRTTLRVFLSQAGPRFDLELLQVEHHLWFRLWLIAFTNKKGDPVGSPSSGLLCG
jgi:hypothetical protein